MIIIHKKVRSSFPVLWNWYLKIINMGIKLCNKFQIYFKNLKNIQLFRRQLKLFLLQETFYILEEYLSYGDITWQM